MNILRDLTLELKKYLLKDEILLIVGARQVGKTTVLHQIADILKTQRKSVHFLNLEDPGYLALLNDSPKNLFKIFSFNLNEQTYLILDEIQYLNNPSNFLKYYYDEYKGKIKIIASGSSAFYSDKKFKDSLAGRKKIFYLYSLSFGEFLKFNGEEQLRKLDWHNLALSEKERISIFYQKYLSFGGYPRVVLADDPEEKIEILRDIAYSYIKKDIFESNIRHDDIFYRLFKILSSQIGNLVNNSELAFTLGVSRSAIDNYLYVMQKSFHIALIRPFFKNMRKELSRMPKVYFMDLGLCNFFRNNFSLYYQREDKGALLENALFRQFLNKFQCEQIKFWRTIQDKEVDFVINDNLAYEVKAQLKDVRLKDHELFLRNYPSIKFNFVSLDLPADMPKNYSVLEIWQI